MHVWPLYFLSEVEEGGTPRDKQKRVRCEYKIATLESGKARLLEKSGMIASHLLKLMIMNFK